MGKKRKAQRIENNTNDILERAHHYMQQPNESEKKIETGDGTENNSEAKSAVGEKDDIVKKIIMTEAEKERKREKNRLKRQRKNDKNLQGELLKKQRENLKSKALEYLRLWQKSPEAWTFKKKMQVWLLKHIYMTSEIPSADFETLLKYLAGLQGLARQRILKDAEEMVEKHDNGTDSSILDEMYDRARQIAQAL